MFGSKNASQVEEFFRKYARNKKDRQGEAYTHTFYTGGSFIVKKRLFKSSFIIKRACSKVFIKLLFSLT